MIKKTITFENFDGDTVTETFHFHLTKADFMEMDAEATGGFETLLEKLSQSTDPLEGYRFLKGIIGRAVGKRDGAMFSKSTEYRETFFNSEAYSELITELMTNEANAASFVVSLFPKELQRAAQGNANVFEQPATDPGPSIPEVQEVEAKSFDPYSLPHDPPAEEPSPNPEKEQPRRLTDVEMRSMDRNKLAQGLAEGRFRL